MLDWKDMRDELARLEAYVDGWAESGEAPAIERDAVLGKLRALYDALRFASVASVDRPISRSATEAAPVEAEEPAAFAAIDLDAVIALETPLAAEPAPAAAEPDPDAVSETERPEPVPEPAVELSAAPESPVAAPEPEPEPKPEPKPKPEREEPTADASQDNDPAAGRQEARPVENSLFDLGELTVRRRGSRRMLMSLYDDEAAEPVRPKRRATPARPETPAGAPSPALPEERVPEVSSPEFEEGTISILDLATEVSDPAPRPDLPETYDEPAVSQPEPESARAEASAAERFAAEAHTVLGEAMRSDTPTLGESIPAPEDVASRLVRSEPLADLRSGLGVNDRFLLLRDLFAGDEQAYEETLGRLDAFDDIDECMIYIAEHFAWNPNSDGAKLLTELLERKLG